MDETRTTDSIGARIVSAAKMAVAMQLAIREGPAKSSRQSCGEQAMVGGIDCRVTDDPLPTAAARE